MSVEFVYAYKFLQTDSFGLADMGISNVGCRSSRMGSPMKTLHHYTPTKIPCKDEKGIVEPRHIEKRRFEVKICSECGRVFENYRRGNNRTKTVYYDSFPKYGLELGICLRCQKKDFEVYP